MLVASALCFYSSDGRGGGGGRAKRGEGKGEEARGQKKKKGRGEEKVWDPPMSLSVWETWKIHTFA